MQESGEPKEPDISRRQSFRLFVVGAVALATGRGVSAILAAQEGGAVITLTDGTWSAEVLKSKIPVLVDFSARWCGACRQMKPICKKLAQEFDKKAKIGELDTDTNEVWNDYKVELLPTFILFKDGKMVDRCVGTQTEDTLRAMIHKAL